jgi:hypothetical protein
MKTAGVDEVDVGKVEGEGALAVPNGGVERRFNSHHRLADLVGAQRQSVTTAMGGHMRAGAMAGVTTATGSCTATRLPSCDTTNSWPRSRDRDASRSRKPSAVVSMAWAARADP